jgi:hypothetical protein
VLPSPKKWMTSLCSFPNTKKGTLVSKFFVELSKKTKLMFLTHVCANSSKKRMNNEKLRSLTKVDI